MSPADFVKALGPYRGTKLLILCHDEADSDALGAAWVLAQALKGQAAVPKKISEHAREVQYKLKMQVLTAPKLEDYDLVVLVDTASPQQLLTSLPKIYFLVDHHANNLLLDGAKAAVYEQTDSTCQLVWKICQALDWPVAGNHALALGAGIMGDTRNLITASNRTIADLAGILEAGGVNYRQLLDLFSISGRIDREVRLEAALGATLHRLGNCLVVSAQVRKNYVYYLAMMLVELGADIALVGYQQGEDCFVRLAKNPGTITDLDSYAIMAEAVAPFPPSNLWGDQDYAGFNGSGSVKAVMAALLAELRKAQRDSCQCLPGEDKSLS